ncbi:MAG TPA: hypothetical protein PK694_05880 [Rhodospirillales bacterium]|jgi:hypothetical protein|nr:hypothetical protein [Rhodospirillales bacterium]
MTGSHGLFEAGLDKTQANFAPLTLLGLLQRAAEVHPEHLAVVHGERRYGWAETVMTGYLKDPRRDPGCLRLFPPLGVTGRRGPRERPDTAIAPSGRRDVWLSRLVGHCGEWTDARA